MNVCDFTPEQLVKEVIKFYPNLKIGYKPDIRDKLAQSWPYNYDDKDSRKDWGWNPKYNSVAKITEIMYKQTRI